MIKLKRVRTKKAIPRDFRGKAPVDRLIDLMKDERDVQKGVRKKHNFPSKWGGTKEQLQAETHGKCAYCEANTTATMYGDVEHYRPKSVYWWLAYVYDNYLASCQLCNQKFKKAYFRVAEGKMRLAAPKITATTTDEEIEELAKTAIPDPLDEEAVTAHEALHLAERPLILNPYIDDPADFFAWKVQKLTADGKKGEVELVPVEGNPHAKDVVKAAEDLLGLNRTDHKTERYEVYRMYSTNKMSVALLADRPELSDLLERSQEMIDAAKADDARYAGMIRYFEAQGGS